MGTSTSKGFEDASYSRNGDMSLSIVNSISTRSGQVFTMKLSMSLLSYSQYSQRSQSMDSLASSYRYSSSTSMGTSTSKGFEDASYSRNGDMSLSIVNSISTRSGQGSSSLLSYSQYSQRSQSMDSLASSYRYSSSTSMGTSTSKGFEDASYSRNGDMSLSIVNSISTRSGQGSSSLLSYSQYSQRSQSMDSLASSYRYSSSTSMGTSTSKGFEDASYSRNGDMSLSIVNSISTRSGQGKL